MMETLEAWDKALFLYLNGDAGPVMDRIMILFSEKLFWIPLYLLLLWLIYKSYGLRGALYAMLAVAVCITLTDQTSVALFKKTILRYRPCKNLALEGMVHNPVSCGGWHGFVSSHAANFFGVATLIGLSLRHRFPNILLWLYIWAGAIGYSRIYLGKHYPADVVGGAILGILLGYSVYLGYQYLLEKGGAKASEGP
jgi:undecaprenyl-diphosphatase